MHSTAAGRGDRRADPEFVRVWQFGQLARGQRRSGAGDAVTGQECAVDVAVTGDRS